MKIAPNFPLPTPRRLNRVLVFGVAALTVVLAGQVNRTLAGQAPAARDGVYTSAQATRGEAVYAARCAACHGTALAGDLAPALAGASFLAIWGPQPVGALFDKIQATMPLDAPGMMTRSQTADVLAHMLRVNKFPAGQVELASDGAVLAQTALAPGAAVPASVAAVRFFAATGNLNQVMRGILFPSSNVLFDVQTQDPGARKAGAKAEAGTTTARYGDVYEPWQVVDAAAIAIAESGPLLMTPGRRCENGKPVPVDRADWQKYVQELVQVGRAAYKASQSRNQDAVSAVTNDVSDACANCHRVYRDVPNAANRCAAP